MIRLNALVRATLLSAVIAGVAPATALAQPAPERAAPAITVTVDRIKVPGPSLIGNLEGNDSEREVWVVLPPSYASSPSRRYPVVYALHGYTMTPEKWFTGGRR